MFWSASLSGERRLDGRQIVRARRSSTTRGLAMNLAHQPAQHGARTHLNIRCDAFRRKAPHDRLPPHRRRHLPHQRLDRRRARRASARRRRWRRSARAASAPASARSSGASRSSAGFISAQWNGALTGQRDHALGAERLGALARARHRVARAGNHHLSGAVQVRRADDLAVAPPPRTPARPASASSPRIAAIAPSPTGTASCM